MQTLRGIHQFPAANSGTVVGCNKKLTHHRHQKLMTGFVGMAPSGHPQAKLKKMKFSPHLERYCISNFNKG
jgi:hypothetical protein